jgi:hypothetical protein
MNVSFLTGVAGDHVQVTYAQDAKDSIRDNLKAVPVDAVFGLVKHKLA